MQQGFPGIGYQGAQDSDSEHRKQNVSPIIIPDCCLESVFRLQRREEESTQSPAGSWVEEMKLGVWGGYDS